MLTHLIICINNFFHTIQAIQFKQYLAYNTHGPFSVQPSKPRLFLIIPIRAVGCPCAAHSPSIVSTLWNRNPGSFLAQQLPNHNLLHKLSHKTPKQSLNCPKRVPKIPTIQSQVLGPIKQPLTASNQPNHLQSS